MSNNGAFPIPSRDPVGGGPLVITELTAEESGVVIRGKFAIPRYSRIDEDQARFLETFLRCRGMLASVEKELGLSYPTVRGRLDALLEALELTPVRDESRKEKIGETKRAILDQLERGEIGPEEAKRKIKEGATR